MNWSSVSQQDSDQSLNTSDEWIEPRYHILVSCGVSKKSPVSTQAPWRHKPYCHWYTLYFIQLSGNFLFLRPDSANKG
jgi:hypothetical protein